MSDKIVNAGSGSNAELSGTYTTQGADHACTFGADGQADTFFTLPSDTPWLLFETYDVEGVAGDTGYTRWKDRLTDIDGILIEIQSILDANPQITTYKLVVTHYKGTGLADRYDGDETTALTLSDTDISYTPSALTWKISDTVVAPGGIEFDIIYTMSMTTDANGVRYLDNSGSTDSIDDAVVKASNSIYLNGVDQRVPYPLIHDLGTDDKKLADSVDIGWTDNLDHSYTGATATGSIIGITTLVSGTVKVSITISGWVEGNVNGYGADGTYIFEETLVASLNLVGTGFTGTVIVNSIEEITIPTNSYLTYFDYDLKEFVTIGKDSAIGNELLGYDGTLSAFTLESGQVSVVSNGIRLEEVGGIDAIVQIEGTPVINNHNYQFKYDIKDSNDTTNVLNVSADKDSFGGDLLSIIHTIEDINTSQTYNITAESSIINIRWSKTGGDNMWIEFDNPTLNEILPISTTYTMQVSHQNVFTHTAPLDAASITHLNANPDAIGRLWNGVLIPELSIVKADMVDYFPCNEGIDGGAYGGDVVQNMATNLSSEIILNQDFEIDDAGWTYTNAVGEIIDGRLKVTAIADGYARVGFIYSASIYTPLGTIIRGSFKIENVFDVVLRVGITTVHSGGTDSGTVYFSSAIGIFEGINVTTTYNYHDSMSYTAKQLLLAGQYFYIDNMSLKTLSESTKIINSTEACRDTYLNTEFGMSNLPFTRDASGRLDGLAIDGEISGEDDGRLITLPFEPIVHDYDIDIDIKHIEGDSDEMTATFFDDSTEIIQPKFISVWRTTTDLESITIPTKITGTYNCTIDWGDGTITTPTAWDDVGMTHEYAVANDYTVKISGTFSRIYCYGNSVMALKLIEVNNLGRVGWVDFTLSFRSANNMTTFIAGNCDTSLVTSVDNMLYSAAALLTIDITGMDTQNVSNFNSFIPYHNYLSIDTSSLNTSSGTSFTNTFYNSKMTDVDVSGFDMSLATDIAGMIGGLDTYDCDISGWNIGNVTIATNFMVNTHTTTAIYDATLVAWEAQTKQATLTEIHFGNSKYTLGSAAETARSAMITAGINIIDGGGI